MEYATKPSSRSSSNVAEIVLKLAKACKFRSIGVFATENPNNPQYPKNNDSNTNALFTGNNSDVTQVVECQNEKVHHQIAESLSETSEYSNVEVLKLFDTLSALKSAYVLLQEAHIPYDPEKIKAADELVVAQFQALCKIKSCYKEKEFQEANAVSVYSALLLSEIQVYERRLKKLKSQIKVKDTRILRLRQEFRDFDLKNRELVQEFTQRERENVKVLSMSSFEEMVKAASKGIHDFAKPLIGLLKATGWDLDKAANSIEDSVVYCKRSHKKYVFEAYIARRMFYGSSGILYNVDGVLNFDDPIDSLIKDPDSSFAQFCRTKYLLVVHPKMEASFFGNLDHRTFVSSGRHPRTPFYQAFVKMARWIWVLQCIAASFNPKAEMFGVKRGSKFSYVHMECVEDLKEDMVAFDEGSAKLKVEFMVMPGFRFGDTLVRSLVYLSKTRSCEN